MPDSREYRVQTADGSWAMIILADEPKKDVRKYVYRAVDGKKKERIQTAWHTCKNPQKPRFLEALSAEGLITGSGHTFKGPAHFIPADIACTGAGFFYRKYSVELPGANGGVVAQDDWEARDIGPNPMNNTRDEWVCYKVKKKTKDGGVILAIR